MGKLPFIVKAITCPWLLYTSLKHSFSKLYMLNIFHMKRNSIKKSRVEACIGSNHSFWFQDKIISVIPRPMPRFCLFGVFGISLSVRLLSRLPLSLSISTWVTPVHTSCYYCRLVAQSCLTLCNPLDCSLPGSSVHGISQGRILGWIPISFSSPHI